MNVVIVNPITLSQIIIKATLTQSEELLFTLIRRIAFSKENNLMEYSGGRQVT